MQPIKYLITYEDTQTGRTATKTGNYSPSIVLEIRKHISNKTPIKNQPFIDCSSGKLIIKSIEIDNSSLTW